ncbi:MAG: hypothetical protein FJ288_03100 [Planctomycetes bacterium]|nr:hypothetical protein [Planctomycetota bacterium]
MFITLAIVAWFVAAVAAMLRPKWGAMLIWPAVWLYPNSALYGTLPLNIRFDDLWLVFMFVLAILYAGGRGGTSTLFWLAVAWAFSMILGNFAGFFISGGFAWQQIVKSALKTLYVPMTAYVISVFVQTEKDLVDYMKAMGLAAAAAGVLGIAMVYFPTALSMFLIPGARVIGFQVVTALEMVEAGEIVARRAQGAVGTTSLAVISLSAALLALCMMLNQPRGKGRTYFGLIAGVCLVALGYTATRGAIGGLIGALLWGMIFTRRRWTLVAVSLIGLGLLVFQSELWERVVLRVAGGPGAGLAPFWQGLLNRLKIWEMFVQNFSPVYLFTGMGMTTVFRLAKGTAHNSYLGAFVYGGIFGVALMAAMIARAWTLWRRLRPHVDPLSGALSAYLGMFIVAMLVFGMVAELFQQATAVQLMFAAMVFVERRLAQVQAAPEAALPEGLLPADALAGAAGA